VEGVVFWEFVLVIRKIAIFLKITDLLGAQQLFADLSAVHNLIMNKSGGRNIEQIVLEG
jgi:hypothetical protein